MIQRRGWGLILLCMLVLGTNKQLDLQSLLTEGGKHVVIALRLFQFHRTVQVAIFAIAGIVAFSCAFVAIPAFISGSRYLRISFVGVGAIAAYVLFRAAQIQKISSKVDLPFVAYLELAGILVTILGTFGQLNSLKNSIR